jgi:hypothetical protein
MNRFLPSRSHPPLIERAYTRVTQRLVEVMAHLIAYSEGEIATLQEVARTLGIDAEPPSFAKTEETVIQETVWRPVAQIFVHGLLPSLLEEPSPTGRLSLTLAEAQEIWRQRVDLHELARQASLSMDDAWLAASAAGQVFFETDLFDGHETIRLRDMEFRISRTGTDRLDIEPVSDAVRPTAVMSAHQQSTHGTVLAEGI